MAQLVESRKGRVIKLDPSDRKKLTRRLRTLMAEKGLDIQDLVVGSTLSTATINARLHDQGEGPSGSVLTIWALAALSEGLGIDINSLAKTLGVKLEKGDIAHAQAVVSRRQLRQVQTGSLNANVTRIGSFIEDALGPDISAKIRAYAQSEVDRILAERLESVSA